MVWWRSRPSCKRGLESKHHHLRAALRHQSVHQPKSAKSADALLESLHHQYKTHMTAPALKFAGIPSPATWQLEIPIEEADSASNETFSRKKKCCAPSFNPPCYPQKYVTDSRARYPLPAPLKWHSGDSSAFWICPCFSFRENGWTRQGNRGRHR